MKNPTVATIATVVKSSSEGQSREMINIMQNPAKECPECGREMKGMVDASHGILGGILIGSERWQCDCGKIIWWTEEVLEK